METEILIPYSKELKEQISAFKRDWYEKLSAIGNEETPLVDGTGKKVRDKKGNTGQEFITDEWMRDRLNYYFPAWSWEMAAPLHFLGAEWVVGQGHLIILDEYLLSFGINPPYRKYYASDAVRIQYAKNQPHTIENIVDVGDSCQAVLTLCLKRAINRLIGTGNDVYGKRVQSEGAGNLTDVLTGGHLAVDSQITVFNQWLSKQGIALALAYEVLGIKKLGEITSFEIATKRLVEWSKAGRPRGEQLVTWRENNK